VATRDGVIVGAIMLEAWEFNRSVWVNDLRVAPAYRRQGVGRALIDAAVEHARRLGYVSVRLETQNDNVDAVQFYLRCGFRFSGFDDRLYLHQHPDPERENRIALFFTYPVGPPPPTSSLSGGSGRERDRYSDPLTRGEGKPSGAA
jgi:RimJ/RimL family protein N-acetyltransferase